MERVGERLRQRREEIGLTIDDIARATKYRPEIIRQIEEGRTRIFPADAYLKAFIRAYAREVGLDPGEVVRMLDQERSTTDLVSEKLNKGRKRVRWWFLLVIIAAIGAVLVIGVSYFGSFHGKEGKEDLGQVGEEVHPRRVIGTVKITDVEPVRSESTLTLGRDRSGSQSLSKDPSLNMAWLEIVASDSVFLTIASGDDTLLSGRLEAGDSRQVYSDKDFIILYLSNRNGLSLRVNGKRFDLPESLGTRVRNFVIPLGQERKSR